MSTLQKIQQRIIDREYFMSSHAEEEMLDDNLERKDIVVPFSKDTSKRNSLKTRVEQDTE